MWVKIFRIMIGVSGYTIYLRRTVHAYELILACFKLVLDLFKLAIQFIAFFLISFLK